MFITVGRKILPRPVVNINIGGNKIACFQFTFSAAPVLLRFCCFERPRNGEKLKFIIVFCGAERPALLRGAPCGEIGCADGFGNVRRIPVFGTCGHLRFLFFAGFAAFCKGGNLFAAFRPVIAVPRRERFSGMNKESVLVKLRLVGGALFFAPSLGFCVVKFFVVKLGLSAGTRNGVSLRNAFGKLFARFSEGKPCDNKQHDNINARQCNASARDAEQLCKKVCKASAEKTSAAAQTAAFGPCMVNSLSEVLGGNQFCIFGKVNERKQRECGSGCANDCARAGIVLSNCDNTNSECRTKHGHCIHSDAENAEKQRHNCRNDPLGRTGGIAEYAEYDADKYKHDSDYLALGIGRIGGFAALLFSVS